jgi:bacillithiol biosynthesis cysteine-adding enzyme BshC
MRKTTLDLSETGQFPQLLVKYLGGDNALSSFYGYSPFLSSFGKAIAEKDHVTIDRDVLVRTLKEQYKDVSISKAVQQNIDALADENTFTVTTGHQLCLFTGPLYFIYKIITTINLAEELKKAYPSGNFVPVYWMASEDHDFAEIDHAHMFGKTLKWEREASGAVGRLDTKGLDVLVSQIEEMISKEQHGNELVQLLRDAYVNNSTLAAATRSFVNALFSEYGLLVIDPDDKELKKHFVSVLHDDIFNNTNERLVNETIARMEEQKLETPVTPREINVFYMHEGLRERIAREGDKFIVVNANISFTREELEKVLQDHPERFSPNVVLRPLYQQALLPNLAYVGGPAEVAYWMEYKQMFEHHKLRFPVLMPRNFAMLFDKGVNDRMEKLGLSKEELFTETEALVKSFVSRNSGEALDISNEEEQLKKLYEDLATKAEKIDPTLRGSVEAELQKQLNALRAIQGKLLRAEKQRQETSVNQVRKLKEKLFPNSSLQERYENFVPYYAKHGAKFISMLKQELHPFEFKMMLLDVE